MISQSPADAPPPPPCRAIGDFHTAPARALALRLLAPFLEEHGTVPLELLHNVPLQMAFEGHALRRVVPERLADAQAALVGTSVAQRAQDLNALFTALQHDTRARLRDTPPSVIAPGGYRAAVAAARAERLGFDADFLVYADLAHTLHACKSRPARIDLLLTFCEEAEETDLAPLEALLAEHLAFPGALRGLWRSPPLAVMLDVILGLIDGAPPGSAPMPALARRLQGILGARSLPLVRAALVTCLHRELQSPDRLVEKVEGDLLGQKALLADLMATAELVHRLKRPDGFIGGKTTHDLLDRRVAVLTSADKLQELMRGRSIIEKVRDLFRLQAAVAATGSTRTIDDYLLLLLDGRDFIGRVYDLVEATDSRLRVLAEIQGLILTSPFPPDTRQRLAAAIDRAQGDLIKATPLFAALRRTRKPPPESVLHVLDLAAEGAFARGRTLAEARELLRRHVRHREFLRHMLAGDPDTPIGVRLAALGERFRKAGLEFRDLSGLTVLVVDDEDAARGYVEMVLRDMGVGSVIAAADGRAALEAFQDFEDGIDLIICDWMMPRMSGLDFLKQVRSVRPHLPFLMVTALATVETVQQAIAHDVTAYIAKPFPPEQLEEKILLLLNRFEAEGTGEGAGTGAGAASGSSPPAPSPAGRPGGRAGGNRG